MSKNNHDETLIPILVCLQSNSKEVFEKAVFLTEEIMHLSLDFPEQSWGILAQARVTQYAAWQTVQDIYLLVQELANE